MPDWRKGNTMNEIHEKLRAQIEEFLPNAIKRALDSYFQFSIEDVEEKESKKFAAHHAAAKAAMAHIELLLKLAKMAEIPEEALGQGGTAELEKALKKAHIEINEKSPN